MCGGLLSRVAFMVVLGFGFCVSGPGPVRS